MATKYTTKLTADTSLHDKALKRSANEVYKYNKKVDGAKNVLGKFAKVIPLVAAAFGVTTGAMAVFKKMIDLTQSATDSWGRTVSTVNGVIDTLANRMSGVGFGSFIDGLKLSAKAAKDAYNALDELGTMTIFQDKATADYNYKKAQYERIIKDKKSNPREVKEAQEGLKKLREEYAAGQQALATQALKAYQAQMQQVFANAGIKVSQLFIDSYLGSYGGFQLGMSEYADLLKKRNTENRAKYYYDQTTGQKMYTGEYLPLADPEEEKKYQSLKVVSLVSDEKLKEANAHYINARNIQTALIQDEIQQNRMNQAADKRVDKENKETKPEKVITPYSIEDLLNQIKVLQDEQKQLNLITEEGAKRYHDIDLEIANIQGDIDYYTSSEGPSSLTQQYSTYIDTVLEATLVTEDFWLSYQQACQDALDQASLDKITKQYEDLSTTANSLSEVFSALGRAIGDTAGEWLSFAAQAFESMSKIIPIIAKMVVAKLAESMSSGIAAAAKMPYPYNLAAIATVVSELLTVFAAIPKFANGGIFLGSSTVGDHGLARVNAGEMILNKREQTRLWNLINGQDYNSGIGTGSVTFKVSGQDLVGVLNNYESKNKRIR